MATIPKQASKLKRTDKKSGFGALASLSIEAALEELRKARAQADLAEQRVADAVAVLRAPDMDGYCIASWQDIANVLGVTRQAVQQRYGR